MRKISTREIVMLALLFALLAGVCYYMFFLTPLNDELAGIQNQIAQTETSITAARTKILNMKKMQEELDAIFANGEENVSEIAPYDNSQVVMNQLNGILSASQDYSLTFPDTVIESNGTVRRPVSMRFTCSSYENAKKIALALADSHWRCLVNNISITGNGSNQNIMNSSVTVSATITFFESQKLQ